MTEFDQPSGPTTVAQPYIRASWWQLGIFIVLMIIGAGLVILCFVSDDKSRTHVMPVFWFLGFFFLSVGTALILFSTSESQARVGASTVPNGEQSGETRHQFINVTGAIAIFGLIMYGSHLVYLAHVKPTLSVASQIEELSAQIATLDEENSEYEDRFREIGYFGSYIDALREHADLAEQMERYLVDQFIPNFSVTFLCQEDPAGDDYMITANVGPVLSGNTESESDTLADHITQKLSDRLRSHGVSELIEIKSGNRTIAQFQILRDVGRDSEIDYEMMIFFPHDFGDLFDGFKICFGEPGSRMVDSRDDGELRPVPVDTPGAGDGGREADLQDGPPG